MSTVDSILNTVILLLFFISFSNKRYKIMQTLVEIGLFNASTGLLRRKNVTNMKLLYW